MSECRSYIARTPPSFVDPLTLQVGMVTNGQIINSIYTKHTEKHSEQIC